MSPPYMQTNLFFFPLSDSQSLTQNSLAAEMVKKGLPTPTSFAAGATQFTWFSWYKSTNTDAEETATHAPASFAAGGLATQFTCFTSTKVQILTQKKGLPAPTSFARTGESRGRGGSGSHANA